MAQSSPYPVPSCAECGLASAGRCPTCHHHLCIDHFGLDDHQPCAAYHAKHAGKYICYVCHGPVQPRQWSTAVFAHYIDSSRCRGCHRYVCDTLHTRRRRQSVKIVREGLQSHRYHYTQRYCEICSSLRIFGGLVGLLRWTLVVAVVIALAFVVVR
ncbi:MAG TPA: hypothetical protein VJN88_03435 [Ktedonobacterales bacterium]|nr:hypothetical protein [Ktedonobacterales bacterium]